MPLYSPTAKPRPTVEAGPLARDEEQTIQLFNEASPSVVYITSLSVRQNAFNLDIFEIPQGTGSGFLWDDKGYIVTNFHVIQEASGATVTLSDQSTWTAQLVGVEPDKDIAVLKINAPPSRLRPIRIGTSRGLRVGQRVLAIGNPFGLDHTLTEGLISGLGREIKSVTERPIQGMIQTDAAINPGNSGGPLLDSSGRLIGMNTAIVSPSGAYSGIGFAVPVDTINRIVPQLIRTGKVSKPGLGLRVLESPMLRSRGIVGAVVADVLPGSPAAQAGLTPARRYQDGIRLGDIILAINEKPVESGEDLFLALDEFTPGQEVALLVERNGSRRTVTLRLGILAQ
jgi:S1-C subfamily serine protease